MTKSGLPKGFIDDDDPLPRYVENSWPDASPRLVAIAQNIRTEAEARRQIGLRVDPSRPKPKETIT